MRIVGLTLTAALLGLAAAAAQAPAPAPAAAPQPPGAPVRQAARPRPRSQQRFRARRRRPDLQGNWTNATITPLERLRPNTPLVLTEEAARDDESKTAAALEAREAPSDPNRGAPPVGGEVRKSPNAEPTYLELLWRAGGGTVGGYNSFWVDPGDRVLRVDGQPRSSIIIDPPNGRVPGVHADAARARWRRRPRSARRRAASSTIPSCGPLAERCITSFGNNAGPPMLPNYFYNNSYTHRADEGHGDDPHRDGARRARRPHGRHASAGGPAQVVRRLDRPLGRRHAGHRDHELPPDARLPQLVGKPEGDRADLAQGRDAR